VLELGGGWRLELGFDRLLFIGSAAARVPPLHLLDGDSGRERWGEWMIEWTREPAPAEQSRSGYTAWFVPQPIVVRAWRTGERIRPLGGPGRRLLARCFQEARVPRSRRGSWPVLDAAGHAVWVPGVCRAHEQLPAPGSPALRIDVGRV
jgi:tRNA(Ile)-lysidine synthase